MELFPFSPYTSSLDAKRQLSYTHTFQGSFTLLNCVVSIPLCTIIKFYYLIRLYTTYSNSCKLLQLVNYAICFGLLAIIRLTHKYDLIKV